jgi:hypothetical protein
VLTKNVMPVTAVAAAQDSFERENWVRARMRFRASPLLGSNSEAIAERLV